MIKYNRKAVESDTGLSSVLQALMMYFNYHIVITYICVRSNPGISVASLVWATDSSKEKIQESLLWLFRADLIYSDFEDTFCSKTIKEIGVEYSEDSYFYKGNSRKTNVKEWELYNIYKNMRTRSKRKKELFYLLMEENSVYLRSLEEDLPLNTVKRHVVKIKKSGAVKYYSKPFNALGFPLRSWSMVSDAGWWFQKIQRPELQEDKYRRKPEKRKKRTGIARTPRYVMKGHLSIEETRVYLEEIGMKYNVEEMAYWLSVMSSRYRHGVTDKEYVTRMYNDLRLVYPNNKKKLRMADVKIFYTLNEGYSKFDFLNTL